MKKTFKILTLAAVLLSIIHSCGKTEIEPPPLLKESVSAEFAVARGHLFVLMQNTMTVYDISNESEPALLNEFALRIQDWEQAEGLRCTDSFLIVIASNGAHLYSIRQPAAPVYSGYIEGLGSCASFTFKDSLAYVVTDTCTNRSRTVSVRNINAGSFSNILSSFREDEAKHIAASDSIVFISRGTTGISIRELDSSFALPEIRLEQTVESEAVLPLKDNKLMIINHTGFHQYSYDADYNLNYLSHIAITR